MQLSDLDEIARRLANELRCKNEKFCRQLLLLLANGQPVSTEQIATALHLSRDEVIASLRQLSETEIDRDGNIVGSGLSLIPTPHRFHINGYRLFTWCALDALMYPVTLQLPARIESPCPGTGINIRLMVTPVSIEQLEPASAVVSIVIPKPVEGCRCDRSNFCNHGHFFSSVEAASTWLSEQQDALILSVDEAYQFGRMVVKYRYGEALE